MSANTPTPDDWERLRAVLGMDAGASEQRLVRAAAEALATLRAMAAGLMRERDDARLDAVGARGTNRAACEARDAAVARAEKHRIELGQMQSERDAAAARADKAEAWAKLVEGLEERETACLLAERERADQLMKALNEARASVAYWRADSAATWDTCERRRQELEAARRKPPDATLLETAAGCVLAVNSMQRDRDAALLRADLLAKELDTVCIEYRKHRSNMYDKNQASEERAARAEAQLRDMRSEACTLSGMLVEVARGDASAMRLQGIAAYMEQIGQSAAVSALRRLIDRTKA